MSQVPPYQPPQSGPAVPPPGFEPVSSGMRIGLAILSFFVPLVGIILGVIFMNDPNPSKKEAGKLWLIVAVASIALNLVCVCAFMGLGILGGAAGNM